MCDPPPCQPSHVSVVYDPSPGPPPSLCGPLYNACIRFARLLQVSESAEAASPHTLPTRALLLFSGPYRRPDGLAAKLRAKGWSVDQLDRLEGGYAADIRNPSVFSRIVSMLAAGEYGAVFLGIPCSTFSVCRIRSVPDGGPPQVRNSTHPYGIPHLEAGWEREVAASNNVTERSVFVALLAAARGAIVIIENPVSCAPCSPWARPEFASHCPLWMLSIVRRWFAVARAESVDMCQCALGSPFMAPTTLAFTPNVAPAMRALCNARCPHGANAHP